MIKSLTPYYINVPFVDSATGITCSKYTLKIYVWDGLKNVPPASAAYEITKFNPTGSTGVDKINIARLVNDFIDFSIIAVDFTQLTDGNNQKWVQTEIYYDNVLVPREQTVQLLLRGYGYGMEGENPQTPTNKILIPIQDYKVNRDGKFIIPIIIDEPTVASLTLVITNVTEGGTPDDYLIYFTNSRAITNLTVYYRVNGTTDWDIYIGIPPLTSPFPFFPDIVLPGGDYDFMISSFDLLLNETVFSNVFNLVI